MTKQDIANIYRFVGVVEGVIVSLPEQVQTLIYDCIEVVDDVLEKEVKGGAE